MRLPAIVFLMLSVAQPALAAQQPGLPATVLPAPVPLIPPASIDDQLEVEGESLAAESLRSRLFIDAAVNGQGPFRFLVDSGADRSVVGATLAERLKLPRDDIVKLRGMAGTAEVSTVLVDTLKIGPSVLTGLAVPALPERFIGAQGIIGIDALADQLIRFDFETRAVVIQDSRRPLPAGDNEIVVTARRNKGQLIITQASVDGQRIFAVIDTGSELTIGNLAMLRRIRRGRNAGALQPVSLQSVTGENFTAQMATLPELRVGGLVIRNLAVAFTDAPPFDLFGLDTQPSLLLGTDLLKSFRRLTLDFRHRKVRFSLRR
jgi:predicted aspartyl protease